MSEPFSAQRTIEIEFGDCDPAGIVFYPNYFRLFDACTAGLLSSAFGMKKPAWTKHFAILGIPMVDTGAKFLHPCKYGDSIRIDSHIGELNRSSFTVSHQLFNGEKLAVDCWETRVWVAGNASDSGSIHAVKIPAEARKALGYSELIDKA